MSLAQTPIRSVGRGCMLGVMVKYRLTVRFGAGHGLRLMTRILVVLNGQAKVCRMLVLVGRQAFRVCKKLFTVWTRGLIGVSVCV